MSAEDYNNNSLCLININWSDLSVTGKKRTTADIESSELMGFLNDLVNLPRPEVYLPQIFVKEAVQKHVLKCSEGPHQSRMPQNHMFGTQFLNMWILRPFLNNNSLLHNHILPPVLTWLPCWISKEGNKVLADVLIQLKINSLRGAE